MRSIQSFMVAVVAIVALAVSAHAETWKKYVNGRYGTFAEYPADRFRALPAPENGDGLSFEGNDGASLTISGSFNVEGHTPASYEKFLRNSAERDFGSVSYRSAGTHSLVLSGLRGDLIFYEKYLFVGDLIHALLIAYRRAAKAEYDPIVTRIAQSLGPRGDDR